MNSLHRNGIYFQNTKRRGDPCGRPGWGQAPPLRVCLILLAIIGIAGISHSADKIILKNNSVIEGKIIKEKGDQIIIELADGKATMGIPKSDILKIIMEKPESFLKAEEAFKKRKFVSAIKSYNEVISKYGRTEWTEKALLGIGQAHMGLKKVDEACKVYEKFLSEYKKSDLCCEVRLILGKIYKNKGMYDKAKNVFNEILVSSPALFTKVERNKPAPDKARELRGYVAEALFLIGEIYAATEKYEEALMSFLRIVVVFYEQSEFVRDAMLRSGFCYEKLEDWTNAKETYEELLSEYPRGKHVKEVREKLNELKNKLKKEKKDEDDKDNGYFACADIDCRISLRTGRS